LLIGRQKTLKISKSHLNKKFGSLRTPTILKNKFEEIMKSDAQKTLISNQVAKYFETASLNLVQEEEEAVTQTDINSEYNVYGSVKNQMTESEVGNIVYKMI
jgi:hypothetical protein